MTHVTNVQTMMMMLKPETIIPVQADVTDRLPPVVRSGSSVPIFKQTVTVSQTHRSTDSEWVRCHLTVCTDVATHRTVVLKVGGAELQF